MPIRNGIRMSVRMDRDPGIDIKTKLPHRENILADPTVSRRLANWDSVFPNGR
jgi:hypothetical protein